MRVLFTFFTITLISIFLSPLWAADSVEMQQRRARLAESMGDYSALVMFPATLKTRNDDVQWPFRQNSNFHYVTNDPNLHSHFVLVKNNGNLEERIFTQLADPYFELWMGKLPTVESLEQQTGVDNILKLNLFEDFIHSLLTGSLANTEREFRYNQPEHLEFYRQVEMGNAEIWLDLGRNRSLNDDGIPTAAEEFAVKLRQKFPEVKIRNISSPLRLMREVKSESELAIMQKGVEITHKAHLAAMKEVQTAEWEYQVQAKVDQTFRSEGACCWSYPSIVGSGPNATILHYIANNEKILPGDLFLLDAGAEYEHYASDITRTFPVSGQFSKDQILVYELVYKAQRASIAQSLAGSNMKTLNQTAADIIAAGLIELGLMTDNTYDQISSYFVHGLGHSVGLDVHDAYEYYNDFVPGNVFTVEPGIYVRKKDVLEKDWFKALSDDEQKSVTASLDRFGGIGVRIEDQVLVTENSPIIMSIDIPVTVSEIEAAMAESKSR